MRQTETPLCILQTTKQDHKSENHYFCESRIYGRAVGLDINTLQTGMGSMLYSLSQMICLYLSHKVTHKHNHINNHSHLCSPKHERAYLSHDPLVLLAYELHPMQITITFPVILS